MRVRTAFLGRFSRDPFGHQVANLLGADGADLSLAYFGSESATLAVTEADSDGLGLWSVFKGTSAANLTPALVPPSLSPDFNALHVGTLGLVLEPMASTLAHCIQREREQQAVMLDRNIRPAIVVDTDPCRRRLDAVIARSTIVKGGDADLARLDSNLDFEAAVDRILGAGAGIAVATLRRGQPATVSACVCLPPRSRWSTPLEPLGSRARPC